MHDVEKFDEKQFRSKTQIKQEMLRLQDLGKQLCELSIAKLATVPLEAKLREAIEALHQMKSHEARRRQLQFIGKLMRNTDSDSIQVALEKHREKDQQHLRFDRLAENWRQCLLDPVHGKEAQNKFFDQYPEVDHQQLRALIRESFKELANSKVPSSQRKLFRYLRDFLIRQKQ